MSAYTMNAYQRRLGVLKAAVSMHRRLKASDPTPTAVDVLKTAGTLDAWVKTGEQPKTITVENR